MKMKGKAKIVLFGDSITEFSFGTGGWGAALAHTYSRKADVLVRGFAGYNSRWALHLLHHIFPQSCADPPAATVIFFGANDAALPGRDSEDYHVPVDECTDNLRKIVYHLKECSPSMIIVLITPPPICEEGRKEHRRLLYGDKASELPERTNEFTGLYAKRCVELAKELGISYIDIWSKMQETQGWQKKFLCDGLHLTAEGNGVVHRELVSVFMNANFSADDLPFDFPPTSEIDSKNPERAFIHL